MRRSESLDAAIGEVVDSGNCSGCGMCTLLDDGLTMQLDGSGFIRPVRTASAPIGRSAPDAVRDFHAACPGARVDARNPPGATRHPTMGPVVQSWAAWANDPEIRFRGSSGGVITALTSWLLETGQSSEVISARADQAEPRRTVSVRIQSRDEALRSAGSRYGPTASAGLEPQPESAFVGKPCEVSALRALSDRRQEPDRPLLISFFCAGTPSQGATDALTARLGFPADTRLRDLWYRGRGWPGNFTVVAATGQTASATYDDSWGHHLGPKVQWRCKICPDGVGESADITAADFWQADSRGYPDFSERDGISALIARTERGRDVVHRAIAAGVIRAEPIDVDQVAAIQPLQVKRRTNLFGRLTGARLAGRPVPKFRGFGLVGLGLADPRQLARTAKGTFGRVRTERRRGRG